MRFPTLRWPAAAAIALALAVPALAGCTAAASAGPDLRPEKTSISVDVFPTVDFAGLYIAEASALQPHDLGLFVRPRSPVRSLAGLKGRTIGVTSADDIDTLLVRALLAENAVGTSAVSIAFGFPLSNVAGQLASAAGQPNAGHGIDAAPIPEPFASEGEEQYGLQELADVDQGVTANFPLDGYAVTREWARKNPRTLAAFDRALAEGQQIADTDRSAFETALRKILGIKRDTAALISLPDYPLSVAPVQLQRVVDAMVQFGMLPQQDLSFKITQMTGT